MVKKSPHIIKEKSILVEGIRLCFQNAQELHKDALLLFNNKRYKRAIALSILALEELSKIIPIYNLGETATVDWSKFWKEFRNHALKQIRFNSMEILMRYMKEDVGIEQVEKWVSEEIQKTSLSLEETKQACFYVDFKDGDFQLYKFEKKLAKDLLEAVREHLLLYTICKNNGLMTEEGINKYIASKKDPENIKDTVEKQNLLRNLTKR